MLDLDLPMLLASYWIWGLSAGLGSVLGLLYIFASLAVNRYALRQKGNRFMLIFVSGMMARLAVTLALVTLILVVLPVRQLIFIGFFLVVFMAGLMLEVASVHRRLATADYQEQP